MKRCGKPVRSCWRHWRMLALHRPTQPFGPPALSGGFRTRMRRRPSSSAKNAASRSICIATRLGSGSRAASLRTPPCFGAGSMPSSGALPRIKAMLRQRRCVALVLLAILLPRDPLAADYADGLAPPGAPASAFPAPGRPVAGIVTDVWHDEESRDRAGEAERVMSLLGVTGGLAVADIGAGSGYYTVRSARRVGPTGHVFAEDVVPEYLERLTRRVASEGLADSVTVVRGDPHDPRLPPGSVDLALLVHMYHEVQQPYGLLWNLRPALRPGARVAVIDARKQTEVHGTPPDLLKCELAAGGYRQTAFYDLQENTYLAVFEPASGPASPAAIRPCSAGHS